MVAVMIGVDPHKGSHTAAAIDSTEMDLGQVRVRACNAQLKQLLDWAQHWPERTWAVENASGLGYLLAQQLVSAGERVLDVPPKLGARVRLLATGDTNKNDPNDARSVAVAALRSRSVRQVAAQDHLTVMRMWAKRHQDLTATRTQSVCRLHAVLCELIPGGVSGQIRANMAVKVLDGIEPQGALEEARFELACDLVVDLMHIDQQIRQAVKHIATAVIASKTTLTGVYGIGYINAAIIKGEIGDVKRFASKHHFASYNGTAPIEVSSGPRKVHRLSRRGNRRLNHALHLAAVTQLRHHDSPGRAYYDRKRAEGKTGKEAIRALKRRISDVVYKALLVDAAVREGPGGQAGNDSSPSAAGSHPDTPALRKSHSRARPHTTATDPNQHQKAS